MQLLGRKAFLLGILVVSTIFLILFWPGPAENNTKIFIDRGSRYQIAETLEESKVISNKHIFWLVSQPVRFFGHLQSGEYEFNTRASLFSVLYKLYAGDVVDYAITIAEGLYTSEIIKLISQDPNLQGEIIQTYDEGGLYPSTYHYTYGYQRQQLISRMHEKMSKTIQYYWDNRQQDLPLKNKYQLLILASIIEKETEFDDERSLVASVFYNRMKKGMKLQTDPTTIYAITKGRYVLDRPLRKKDLLIKSPFNTYYKYGLPPSPICNPGEESIKAAANPEKSKFLYFVLQPSGKHAFSKTYKEHLRNIKKYRNFRKLSQNPINDDKDKKKVVKKNS